MSVSLFPGFIGVKIPKSVGIKFPILCRNKNPQSATREYLAFLVSQNENNGGSITMGWASEGCGRHQGGFFPALHIILTSFLAK